MTDTSTEAVERLTGRLKKFGQSFTEFDAADMVLALAAERDALKSTDNLNHPTRAWAAIEQIADAIGEIFGPVASVESADASLLRGPEYGHRADGIIEALQRVKAADRYAQGHAAALDDVEALILEYAGYECHVCEIDIQDLREGQKDG